jgi:hypothetical protein
VVVGAASTWVLQVDLECRLTVVAETPAVTPSSVRVQQPSWSQYKVQLESQDEYLVGGPLAVYGDKGKCQDKVGYPIAEWRSYFSMSLRLTS